MKIEKLPSGNYRVRVTVGKDESGKPIRKSFTHYDKTRLRRIAAEYADDHRRVVRRSTVGDAIDAFCAAKAAVLSPSTLKGYNSCAKMLKLNHGHFCASYVDEITAKDVQALITDLLADGLTAKTVKNYHGFLSAVFKFSGYRLPAATLPQAERPVLTIPEADDMKSILAAAAGTRLEIPLALAAMGLRRSEICALTLDDLDGNTLHVHRAAVYGTDKAVHVKTTKTYSSDRYIVIPAPLAQKIRDAGMYWDSTPKALSDCFEKFIKRHGFDHYRLHDLRHFFASYCHNELKLSDKQIQAITGHKTSDTLRRVYLHPFDQEKANLAAAESVAGLMP